MHVKAFCKRYSPPPPPPSLSLSQALVGLIRNLALCPENHFPLRQQTVIPKLWNILTRAYTNSSKRGVPGGPQGLIVSCCNTCCGETLI